ncbi:MAG TPA: hypothetical protein VMM17_09015 [Gemmatimonadaceae bacterium]|nr:hypothetical protein [Gemmatimonadaceae bacterium]
MRTKNVWSLVALAGIVMACDSPTAIELAAIEPSLSRENAVVASASGGGKAQLPAGFSLLSFAFTANLRGTGDATGHFRQVYESALGTVDFQGTVTCVSFDADNNRAWIGGVITKNNSTHPNVQGAIHQPGRDVWFRVVDNGEGDSPDDRTTVFGFEGGGNIFTSEQYCAAQLWTAGDVNTWAAIDGNIQVRP